MTSGQPQPQPHRELILGVSPGARPDGRLVVGVCRAGALGVLDLGAERARARAELDLVAARHAGPFGVRVAAAAPWGPDDLPPALERARIGTSSQPPWSVPPALAASQRAARATATAYRRSLVTLVVVGEPGLVAPFAAAGWRVLAEVTSLAEARAAAAAGAEGLVAKGSESGGRIGEETAFVLLQRLVAAVDLPIWAQGGIGLNTAAAAVAGGAVGVVLDAQLALARESTLPAPVRSAIGAMDGSETVVAGGHRIYTRPDLPAVDPAAPAAEVASRLGADDLRTQLLPVGQDASFAGPLAAVHRTAGGIVGAVRAAIEAQLVAARELAPLAPGNGTAATRGTEYPIAQGPMTRVSDRAGFARAVADGGALPFLALSLMRADEIHPLLAETAAAVGDRAWGVGVLGFVPPELRDEQLAVVREHRPPVVLIAGGRPSQAAPLEAAGITTFLHVPSPGLLDRFWKDGARRFVFEGRECGGHVGPRSSFALWQRQIDRLLAEPELAGCEVFFAGGVHDARSAAMVAALAAPLVERGAAVGVLMGTAYVLTDEAVATGAVTETFRRAALDCEETVLLETSPGHATRCVASEYVAAFGARKAELVAAGTDVREMWTELEGLNLGRLRIAAKGIVREGDDLVEVGADVVAREGMFMIGQVAALRDRPTTVADLHEDVSVGATARLDALTAARPVAQGAARRPAPADIAVIGTAGIFPGAPDVARFWANVVAGVDGISEVPPERWSVERYYDPDAVVAEAGVKTPSKWGGFLPDVPFDPMRYGIPPRSLTSIGNDQLLSLEVAAAALADAGYADRPFDRERASVVFGAETGTDLAQAYGFRAALPHFVGEVPAALEDIPRLTEDSFPGVLANVIAGRIANRLDLGGANYTVDAACGASMAALAAACHELAAGTSDLVLCGGADLHNGIYDYLLFSAVHALSPTGRCRTFDAAADGIALGEGVGCVVLKRLADAERDGDRILAVIDAVAASSDGRSLGLTAPRREGQRRALERAYERAGVSPAAVGLVEAHGTGTAVGDRTELATLTDVYAEQGAAPGSVTLGSVKSQIGHTKCAAGIAGVIKAVHALHRGVLPPTLHLTGPNEAYDAKTSPFVFGDVARPWVGADRRAAVSAFGFGGANFHAVLSAYGGGDEPAHALDEWPAELFLLRGASAAEAAGELDRLGAALDANDGAGRPWRLRDLARTAHERRRPGPVRAALVADDLDDLRAKLDRARSGRAGDGVFLAPEPGDGAEPDAPPVALLFPGQGSQRPHMVGDLFVAFPALRRYLDLAGPDLVERMFPPAAFGDARPDRAAALTDTRAAQPALGVAGLAVAALLAECGVRADALGGHSYGELVALTVAGALPEDALVALSRARGEAILDAAPDDDPGAMAAVRGPVAEVRAALADRPAVIVANDNAPDQCVVSGPTAEVEAAVADLAGRGLTARRLPVACAFHTPGLAPAAVALAERLADVAVAAPDRPVWSNTTAAPYGDDPAAVRELLAGQVAAPVAFRDQVEAMYAAGTRAFVEAGPGRVLTQLVGRILGDRPHTAVACEVAGEPGVRRFLLALGELAAAGVAVDADALFAGRDAAVVDVARPPRPAPYRLNGAQVLDADGRRAPGSLPAASELAPLALGAAPAVRSNGHGREDLVAEYLRTMQQVVAAERDVVLAALGAAPPAPAAVVAAPAAPALPVHTNGNGHAAAPAAALLDTVVAIVSERTGYPAEMLDPDLDLEAELSIDSIKRIEILGELAERVGLPGMDGGEVDESVIEELALIKTLRGIVEWVEDRGGEPATVAPPAAAEGLLDLIVAIVSERTGYPAEMLDPDLDLEAELSIDSIKRIEILGELAERVRLPGMDGGEVDESVVEELALIKTLRGIVEWVEDRGDPAPAAGPPAAPAPTAEAPSGGTPVRFVPVLDPLPEPAGDAGADVALAGAAVAVVDDGGGVGAALHALLVERGARATLVATGEPVPEGTATLVDLGALAAGAGDTGAVVGQFARLRAAAGAGAGRLLVATGRGGDLGLGDGAPPPVERATAGAAAAGMVRTFARELAAVRSQVVDVDPGAGPAAVAGALLAELRTGDGPVEVGYRAGGRWTITTAARPLDAEAGTEVAADEAHQLGPGSVVVVTGGGRGIGARLAAGLARATGCGIELVGRSPLPGDEPAHLAGAADSVALRRAIIGRGELARPAEIEAEVARVLAAREIRATLADLAAHAAFVDYRSLDVRDAPALAAALEDVRGRRGRLDGVIHAAGIREDKLIRDKEPDSFARVYDTKVGPALAAVEAVGPGGLVVLFASVSGAFGNAGQVDYAAANSVFDALARRARQGAAGSRVLAIDWGPWAGTGMVTPELAREYERRGVGLVDPDAGVAAALAELRAGVPDAQVVLMCASPVALGA